MLQLRTRRGHCCIAQALRAESHASLKRSVPNVTVETLRGSLGEGDADWRVEGLALRGSGSFAHRARRSFSILLRTDLAAHFFLQVILNADFVDQRQLRLQPIHMFFFALQDVFEQFPANVVTDGVAVFDRVFQVGDGAQL